jgi:hypothetical protein
MFWLHLVFTFDSSIADLWTRAAVHPVQTPICMKDNTYRLPLHFFMAA